MAGRIIRCDSVYTMEVYGKFVDNSVWRCFEQASCMVTCNIFLTHDFQLQLPGDSTKTLRLRSNKIQDEKCFLSSFRLFFSVYLE
jgi:hypothetical protein